MPKPGSQAGPHSDGDKMTVIFWATPFSSPGLPFLHLTNDKVGVTLV